MRSPSLKFMLLVGLFAVPVANACEFHSFDFGMGAYGSNWRTIDPNQAPSEYASSDINTDAVASKPRPSFSNSAIRAAKVAKTNAKSETDAKTSDEAEDAKSD